MVLKCESLPLAISLLGGVLIKKKSIDEWELVNRNINTYLYRGEGVEKEKKLDGVLNLSYEDLPYYLKPCLLYMGQFRGDQIIYVGTLYRLWIAEGMISRDHGHGDNETLMDIAELYLNELVSRSIVNVEVEDFLKEQRYVSCRLHDAGKEDFGLQIIENDQSGNFGTLLDPKTRHLVIHCHEVQVELENDGFPSTRDDSRRYKNIEFLHNILDLHKFKLLRVLVIRRCNFKGRKLPRGIANLVHLKYLGLFCCALDELPSSISNLRYLYTLDSWDVRVPNVLKKMHRLKHLVLPYYRKENIGEYRLRLEGLEELEILYGFDSLVHDLKSVTKMKNLQYFEAIAHDNQSVSSIINAITTNWKKLRFCKLVIGHGCEITPTKEGSMFLKKVFTCSDLHYLWIHVHVGKLIHEYHNEIIGSRIVRLQLMECEIEEDPMEILGKLSSLQQLFLSNRSYVGKHLKCHALDFPCLKNLVLKCLPNLKEWRVEKGAMPALSEIEINRCLRLKMVPYGLRFVSTLKKLKITGMRKIGKKCFGIIKWSRRRGFLQSPACDFHYCRRLNE
ncbi:hypothetical protein CDL12_16992 [Handroanthus impetiginosus]|uniref:Uncharacterized protein n=1 Tax=Handroanthus impetiginosus TaxID=429701 RepID=A0A2G9GYQ6_9LAMI|nr:hypothetical protein CDL12_16992 [Handroanthus impetiginosus]